MFDTNSSTLGGNLTCPGQRQLLLNYIQPKSTPSSVSNAPAGAWDPCFSSWLIDTSDITLPSIPAGTPYTAQQLVPLLKKELCFFKWYSTFNTSSPPPWVADPDTHPLILKSAVTGSRMVLEMLGWGIYGLDKQECSAYYTDTSVFNVGCGKPPPAWSMGTFSYIDAGEHTHSVNLLSL
jgi:hypothetical protein